MKDIVLDPFAGSGTTLETAAKLGRTPLGIELNGRYIKELMIPAKSDATCLSNLDQLP